MKIIFNKKSAYFAGGALALGTCILTMPLAPNLSILVFGGLSTFLLAQGFTYKKSKKDDPISLKAS